jgi:hypothetical protein
MEHLATRAARQNKKGRFNSQPPHPSDLKIEANPHLTFAARQVLLNRSDTGLSSLRLKNVAIGHARRAAWLQPVYCCGVVAVEKIKHFEKHLRLDTLADIEALGDA